MSSLRLAIVNAYRKYTGSTAAAWQYYRGLKSIGAVPKWYQCVSSGRPEEWNTDGVVIRGVTIFHEPLNQVINAFTDFPTKLASLGEEITLLTDPILLRSAPKLRHVTLLVHDMREFGPYRRSWLATQVYRQLFRALPSVERIICVSRATQTRLEEVAQPSAPIHVIHHPGMVLGDAKVHLEGALKRIEQDRSLSVLYVAADRPYKNIAMFIRLAKAIETQRRDLSIKFRLVSTLRESTAAAIRRFHLSNLEVVPSISDWKTAYQATDVLVHPSLEEGYGLPLVEAMQFGIPIVSTDIPAVRETVSGGGQLLSPECDQDWIDAITSLTNKDRYQYWAAASAGQGQNYTAEKFLAQLRGVFSELVADGDRRSSD
jgi:glycosyltransferase involved in cell wall biosynthesis